MVLPVACMDVRVEPSRILSTKELMFSNYVVEKTLESPLDSKENPTSQSKRKSVLNIHWKDWCWSWSSDTLATCQELTLEKTLMLGKIEDRRKGDDRGWDGWMALPTLWTWVWATSRRWWRTGKPGMLQSEGSQRVRHDWVNNNKKWLLRMWVSQGRKPEWISFNSLLA